MRAWLRPWSARQAADSRRLQSSTWIVNRLAHPAVKCGPLANFFQHIAHEATPKAQAILVKADQVADEVGLDDEVLDGVLVKLGLE